ncbi:hypothetical protein OY671_001099 [Metschnikowia pulcherrima]|nr:hypothetical protein OY671_001099 [Metschnikowia pulcherrima]
MSAFSPLNLVQDVSASKKDLEEEHTRELEIQNAYKTYQDAIALQSQKRWVDAYRKYKELAESAVIVNHFYEEVSFVKGFQNGNANLQPDELSFIPQNVKKIRFLFFRNRGFLHFNILKAGQEVLNEILIVENEPGFTLFELQKDLFYTMFDGFVNCFLYEEADESILRILYDICTYLDVRRLAKLTLEYAISYPSESEESAGISFLTDWADPLWKRFKDSGLTFEDTEKLEEKLVFLRPIKEDFMLQMSQKARFNSLRVSLKPDFSWLDVINGVNLAMREHQDKERVQEFSKIACKYFDPYSASETPLDDIIFEFLDRDTEIVQVTEEQPEDSQTTEAIQCEPKPLEVEPHNPSSLGQESSNLAEKASMRLSKRLNPGDSAPVYADDIALIRRYFIETEVFFNHLNGSFQAMFNFDQPILNDMVGHLVKAETVHGEPAYIYDFLSALNEWKVSQYDEVLFPESKASSRGSGQSDRKRLIEVLTSFGNQFSHSKKSYENLHLAQNTEFIRTFLESRFSTHCHVNQAKLQILSQFMKTITSTAWDEQLYEAVSEWVVQLEGTFQEICAQDLRTSNEIEDKSLAVGIYECLINCYIVTQEMIESLLENGAHTTFVKSVKANFNSSAIELLRVKDRIDKWKEVLKATFSSKSVSAVSEADIELMIRYHWATNYYIAAKSYSWNDKKFVVVHLHSLAQILSEMPISQGIQIAYPNCSKIGEFSREGLQKRLSTASILSIFSKILDQSDSETSSTNETISLLESILFEANTSSINHNISMSDECESQDTNRLVSSVIHGLAVLDKTSLSSVKEFFHECPVDLKLSLWNILFSYYQRDSFYNFQRGLEYFLAFILDHWESPSYHNSVEEKHILLLSLVASYRNHLKTFLGYLSQNKWLLPAKDISLDHIMCISRMYELCYLFSLHEEAALYTSRKVSLAMRLGGAFQYFKDFFIECLTVLSTYCFNYMAENPIETADSLISDYLVLVHHQLGLRRLCDSSNGLFLRFSEDCLVNLSKIPETELTQIMSCRYHYRVKLYGQFPVDHYTVKSADLNKQSAEELASFILPLCFRTNPLTQTPRNDLKQVVDDLFEIIGDPDVEADAALSENTVTVEKFIDRSSIGPRFVKEAFYGLLALEMASSHYANKVAQKGLYFVEAVLLFNTYKIRKKSAQSRTVELERIITILTYDLIYGSDRVESWVLLAQAYGYIVEDDLIWTSDKINTVEKKIATANLQRKSLVCYLMAISTITRQNLTDSEALKPVMNVLMNSFVKELYSASRSPMDMLAFQVHGNSKFVRQNDKIHFMKLSETPSISRKFCLVLMSKCLDLALRASKDDWNSLYYAAKVRAKLNYAPEVVLNLLLRSSDAAKKQSSSGDLILEPTYKLLSLLYKYVKLGKLSGEDGARYIGLESMLMPIGEPLTQDAGFYQLIIACLRRIMQLDKKGWYHKPAYRSAFIQFTEFNDVKGAKNVLAKHFTLRSNNKTFLQMWKPEHERPGRHFVYMFQYTRFYISLLTHDQDLTSLALMYPKLRRANSTMVSLNIVWEQLCTSICKIVREILDVDALPVKYFLLSMPYSTFMARAQKMVDAIASKSPESEMQRSLSLLHIVTDIRKLNNGFGPTALIDNTFSGIFIKIFHEFMSKHREFEETTIPDSPNGKSKKLAKKDVFPFAIELATKCKRDVEHFLKINPDIFNFYVTQHEREMELLRQQKAEEQARHMLTMHYKFQRELNDQFLFRGQRIAMFKMLAFTRPEGAIGNARMITNASEPRQIQKSIDFCGPEALAADFNQQRRFAREGGAKLPGNSLDVGQTMGYNLLSLSDIHGMREINQAVGGSSHGEQIWSSWNQATPNNWNSANVPGPTQLIASQDSKQDAGVGLTTNQLSERTDTSDARTTTSEQPGNFDLFWAEIARKRQLLQKLAHEGTFDDPVEIESDEARTPEADRKRRLEDTSGVEQSASKRST